MSNSIWSILGIAATRDVGAIKRAYAAKLKAIDLDTDPADFQLLREAKDLAIGLAEAAVAADASPLPAEADELPPVVVDDSAKTIAQDDRLKSDEEISLNEHHQQLAQILFQIHGDQFYAATPAEEAAMLHHFQAIIESPLLQDVGTLTNASGWFAGAVAQMIPRSDVLIEPAAKAFGWSQADEIGSDPAIAFVMQRHADLAFAGTLDDRRHRLHKAWQELRTPAAEHSVPGWVNKKKVRELITTIRGQHPSLERHLDWWRVSLWERKLAGETVTSTGQKIAQAFGVVIAMFFVLAFIGSVTDDSRDAQAQRVFEATADHALRDEKSDIDMVARRATAGQIDSETLKAQNPALNALLHAKWEQAAASGKLLRDFEREALDEIESRRNHIWPYAPTSLLVERFTLQRDIARSLGRTSAQACISFLNGGSPQLYGRQIERMNQLAAHEVLAIDPSRAIPAESPSTIMFNIPNDVFDDVAKRTGQTNAQLKKALRYEDDALSSCESRIALYDSVLTLPTPRRDRMLRDMATD